MGLSFRRQTLVVMAIAGALAGFAGIAETSTIEGRLQPGISIGYGLTGFLVAWLVALLLVSAGVAAPHVAPWSTIGDTTLLTWVYVFGALGALLSLALGTIHGVTRENYLVVTGSRVNVTRPLLGAASAAAEGPRGTTRRRWGLSDAASDSDKSRKVRVAWTIVSMRRSRSAPSASRLK